MVPPMWHCEHHRIGEHEKEVSDHIRKDDGTTRTFKESDRGLFYFDTSPQGSHVDSTQAKHDTTTKGNHDSSTQGNHATSTQANHDTSPQANHASSTQAKHITLVSTVEKNKSKFTTRDYDRAKMARRVQVLVGRPELKDFVSYLDKSMITNCPIDRTDAITAHQIFGRDVDSVKGKTTRQGTEHVPARIADIPVGIMAKYRDITLCIDNMFVNKVGFFMSISRDIHFITAEAIPNRQGKTIMACLLNVYGAYRQRGFRITHVHGDLEFECL
jgi:hypothetical protein